MQGWWPCHQADQNPKFFGNGPSSSSLLTYQSAPHFVMPGNFLQVVPTASQQTMNSREFRYHSSNLAHEIPYLPHLLSHVNQMRGQLNYVMQAMQNCVATCPLESGQTAEAVHNSFSQKICFVSNSSDQSLYHTSN